MKKPKFVKCENCRYWLKGSTDGGADGLPWVFGEGMGVCMEMQRFVYRVKCSDTETWNGHWCSQFRKSRWYDWLYWWLKV